MKNISWLFYKDYFDGLSFLDKNSEKDADIIKIKNSNILSAPLEVIKNSLATHRIYTTIQYPGLVTGAGINHEANIKGEYKLGVHFNYTFGMPVIYGSSVKGLLRSAFPDSEEVTNKEKNETNKAKRIQLRNAKIKLIDSYLNSKDIGMSNIDIDALRDQIFEGIDKNEKGEIAPLSIYKRDIFFDAVIVEPHKKKDGSTRFLESDSITPHIYKELSYERSVLKNPTPLTFLKIASGVKMEFRFALKTTIINGVEIKSEKKKLLFKKILEDFGIGAKTNVGYGQFSGVS